MSVPNHADYAFLALCLWREARGEGVQGIAAVAFVIHNRVAKHNSSYFAEVTKPWQFSSITAKGDPQLIVYPHDSDPIWFYCQTVARQVIDGMLTDDPTNGSTLYYDDSISFPCSWDKSKCKATVKIGRLNFFQETA